MAKRIAYVVNHVAFFMSHRLPLAVGALEDGFEVGLFTGQSGSVVMEDIAVSELANTQILHRRALFGASSLNPFREFVGLVQLIWFLLRFMPDIIHCVSPKGVIYGGIAARICRVPVLLIAISGMGFAYTTSANQGWGRSLLKLFYGSMLHFVFRHKNTHVIVQNMDDYKYIFENGLAVQKQLTLIPGSGVDLGTFLHGSLDDKENIILLPARMIKEKGILEFVSAARKIRVEFPSWRFILAGAADYDNPSAISAKALNGWHNDGIIEWHGHVVDIALLFNKAAIVCLPSYYREGMPKSLLEAAAAGCAVVTTDSIGCKDAIVAGVTGDLVPPRDGKALADCLLALILDKNRRSSYGIEGRKRAIEMFSVHSVVEKTLSIYRESLTHAR